MTLHNRFNSIKPPKHASRRWNRLLGPRRDQTKLSMAAKERNARFTSVLPEENLKKGKKPENSRWNGTYVAQENSSSFGAAAV